MSANIPLQCRHPNADLRVRTATDHAGNVCVQLAFFGLPPATVRTQIFNSRTMVTERVFDRAYYNEPIYFHERWMRFDPGRFPPMLYDPSNVTIVLD